MGRGRAESKVRKVQSSRTDPGAGVTESFSSFLSAPPIHASGAQFHLLALVLSFLKCVPRQPSVPQKAPSVV